MNIKTIVAAAAMLSPVACATGPLDYRAQAPVATRRLAADSLQSLSVARARSLGLTIYAPDSAVARLLDLGIGINTNSDFLYADHAHGCGLFCKQIDFVIVTFHDAGYGDETVQVDAGSYKRPALLADWRLVTPSTAIRAIADSLAATFGPAVVQIPVR